MTALPPSQFPARVSKARHDLNNSIGHVLGFAEMLVEEAQEPGQGKLLRDLELVFQTARHLAAQTSEALAARRVAAGHRDFREFHESVCKLSGQIITASGRASKNSRKLKDDVFRDDLARIAAAARKAMEIATGLLTIPANEAATERHAPQGKAGEAGEADRAGGVGGVGGVGRAALLRRLPVTRDSRTSEYDGAASPLPPFGVPAGVAGYSQDRPKLELQASGSTLLVVDDLEENRELLNRRLSRLGYSVQLADNGEAALQFVAANPVDLILLDILMPGVNGIEVLRRLKSNPATQHIPVVMLSSSDQIDTVVRCIELGADDFLPKPFNAVLLMARIQSSLSKKRLRDQEVEFLKQLQAEQEISERLLLNILPKPVAERLKRGEKVIADSFPEVTVLFSDFVGFTKLSATITAAELVGRLNEIFSAFDQLCDQHGLEKIKMIGDAYMVVGGLPVPRADHAAAIARLALAMQAELARFSATLATPLRMRIGIHTGPVVAGVIGTKKFAYDLWGDTVNLASRMESHAPTGGILVTAATYKLLRGQFRFRAGRATAIKGKGRVTTHLLIGEN